MAAVYLASWGGSDALTLAAIGVVFAGLALSGLSSAAARRLVWGLVLVVGLGIAATRLYAVPYNCPALWKYLGICG